MRKIILFILFSLGFHSFILAQNTEWAISLGGPKPDKGISIGTDTLGFIYASGYFNTTATFGTITLTNSSPSGNNKEAFIVKMDSTGNVIWALAGGDGTGSCCDDRALGMHVTPNGYVFVTGTFWSSFNIGTCSISFSGANSHDSSLLTKIDPNGNCVWARSFGADEGAGSGPNCPYPIYDADDHSYDVKVARDGFIYITGFFSGVSAEFDAITLNNPNWGATCTPLGYVAKLDSSGNFIWAHKFDGIKDDRGSRDNRIAIDNFSNVYVVGGFENTGNYGPIALTSVGEFDAFIFKMDKDGNFLWARNVGSNKTDRADGIAIDYCDNVYVSGEYRNPMVFSGANASNGTDTLSHKKKRDIFVAKITTNGDWVWAKRARSEGTDKPYQMSVDEDMQVYIGGSAGDSLRFDGNLILSTGDTSTVAFVAQLDGSNSTGSWVWAKLGGGPSDDDRVGEICEDGRGNLYATGFYEQTADFDGNSLTSLGKKDVFVWRLKKANVVPTPTNCIYVDVQPAGSGYLVMNGTTITEFPCLQSLSDSTNQLFDAVANPGFSFTNWDWGIHNPSPNTTNPNSTVFTYSNDTLIVNFNAIVTDTVVYITQPAGAGTMTLDGTNVSVFPHTEYHIQGDTSSLVAAANAGYNFVNWDFQNNSPNPNNTATNINVVWAGNDTVYLNFDTVPTYEITYVTNIPGAGSIDIDGFNQAVFPFTNTYQSGANVILGVNNNPNFTFREWSTQTNTLNPSNQASIVDFNVTNDDTIIAHYDEVDTLWIITRPVGTAQLEVGSDLITTSPYMGVYQLGELLPINVSPYASNIFNQWDLSPATLPDYNPSSAFIFVGQDTLFASLNNVLAIQDIGDDFNSINLYPNLIRNDFNIEMEASQNLEFEVRVLGMTGQDLGQIYQASLHAGQSWTKSFSLDVAAGLYFIQLRSESTLVNFKVIKQ